jgi:AraC-like DNA-binding protein
MMRDPAIRLTEVALELGYAESANFTRAFRRWTRLAPRLYRQSRL